MKASRRSIAGGSGFTLIEIAMVVAILSVIALLVSQRMANFARRARTTAAENDMKTIAGAVNAYLQDMTGIPGFSVGNLRIANLMTPTNLYGAVAMGAGGSRGVRVDDPALRHPGVAAADEFTSWSDERGRGWRGPYVLHSPASTFPASGGRRFAGDATFAARGFYPPLSGLWLPDDIVSGLHGCSVYGFPGEPALSDPWGNPYVLQIPPVQAFQGFAADIVDETRFSYSRIVSAGPNGILETPCFAVNATNSVTTAWPERTRRLARQAGLIDGGDAAARGDDMVLFLRRADIDEGEAR